MQRDWDLVRHILLRANDAVPPALLVPRDFATPTGGQAHDILVFEHVLMLQRSGYVEATITESKTGSGGGHFMLKRMTWDGHDLLAKMRSDTWWGKIKATAKDKGLELTFDLIKTLAGPAAAQVLGIPSAG